MVESIQASKILARLSAPGKVKKTDKRGNKRQQGAFQEAFQRHSKRKNQAADPGSPQRTGPRLPDPLRIQPMLDGSRERPETSPSQGLASRRVDIRV